MKNSLILFFILSIFSTKIFAQEKTGFAINPNANNIAALFTMTNENGRMRNLELMESVFKDGSLGFSPQKYHNVTSNFIYKKLTEISSKLDDSATLLLYFNSHGGGSGNRFAMMANGESFRFSKALEAISKGKTVKRLIFLIDTCHAAGGIQEGLKSDGELLKNIKNATPTDYLPELPDKFSSNAYPFISIFNFKENYVDFGLDSNAYEQILIISSSSVEDLSTRGVFASRFTNTFYSVKNNQQITVGDFLLKFANNHSKSGQQPYYKILPDKSMLNEYLFGPFPAQLLPIVDNSKIEKEYPIDYIPMPTKN